MDEGFQAIQSILFTERNAMQTPCNTYCVETAVPASLNAAKIAVSKSSYPQPHAQDLCYTDGKAVKY